MPNQVVYSYARGQDHGYVVACCSTDAAIAAAHELGVTVHGVKPDRAETRDGTAHWLYHGAHMAGSIDIYATGMWPRELEGYSELRRQRKFPAKFGGKTVTP